MSFNLNNLWNEMNITMNDRKMIHLNIDIGLKRRLNSIKQFFELQVQLSIQKELSSFHRYTKMFLCRFHAL